MFEELDKTIGPDQRLLRRLKGRYSGVRIPVSLNLNKLLVIFNSEKFRAANRHRIGAINRVADALLELMGDFGQLDDDASPTAVKIPISLLKECKHFTFFFWFNCDMHQL